MGFDILITSSINYCGSVESANICADSSKPSLLKYIKHEYCVPLNPYSATYYLQQTRISNFAAFKKITKKS